MPDPHALPSALAGAHASVRASLTELSRRRVLLTGLAAWAMLPLAGNAYAAPATPNLTPKMVGVFEKALAVMIPTAGSTLVPASEVPVVANVDQFVGQFDPTLRDTLRKGLGLFDDLATASHGRPFHRLPDAAASRWCTRWQYASTNQRLLVGALRQIVLVAYWRDPRTWAAIGYDGPVSRQNNLPRLGNAPSPEA